MIFLLYFFLPIFDIFRYSNFVGHVLRLPERVTTCLPLRQGCPSLKVYSSSLHRSEVRPRVHWYRQARRLLYYGTTPSPFSNIPVTCQISFYHSIHIALGNLTRNTRLYRTSISLHFTSSQLCFRLASFSRYSYSSPCHFPCMRRGSWVLSCSISSIVVFLMAISLPPDFSPRSTRQLRNGHHGRLKLGSFSTVWPSVSIGFNLL